jgi:anti-anti-sigma factor
MSDPLLAISTSRSNLETTIKLSGECDHSNVDDLNRVVHEILMSETRRIVLDVEELNYMGSCGLTSIERALEVLQPVGGIVVVHKPAWMLKWLLDFFGISKGAVIVE